MNRSAWLICALLVWWLVATVGCGGAACIPYILFFYLPFWLPVVAFAASAESASGSFAPRWSPFTFIGLIALGGLVLLYFVKGRWPYAFEDSEHALVPVGMVLKPSAAVSVLYLIKVLYDRMTLRPVSTR